MSADVWIVVLTWNGREDTLACLASLRGSAATVLVVDNGSADGTVAAVRETHPWAQILENGDNLGYAGGNNVGIRCALDRGARVIGVLNNDTEVDPGWLDPLVAAIEAPGRRAVSPDIRYFDDPATSWFRGGTVDPTSAWPRHLTPNEQPPSDGHPHPTPLLTGCCLFATSETWRAVGLFDEGLFLTFEDSDWSMRATKLGAELLIVSASTIRHRVSRSFRGNAGLLGSYYFARNGTVFAYRHLGPGNAVRFAMNQIIAPTVRDLLSRRTMAPAVMRLLGLAAALTGRRGPAGLVAQRVAGRTRS